MNNNVFLQKQYTSEKFNPDVNNKFIQINSINRQKINNNFIPEYYKSITNEPVKTKITSHKDLQLKADKPDLNKLLSNYEETYNQRMMELNIVKKSIENYKKINGIIEKTPEQLNDEFQIEQHELLTSKQQYINNIDNIEYNLSNSAVTPSVETQLDFKNLKSGFKSYTILEGEKLEKEKQKYNELLLSLQDII